MSEAKPPPRPAATAIWAFSAATFLVHLLVGRGYGYFRDEFYYLACADHPAFGYVDHPPLSVWLLWVVRHTIGDSVVAIRLLPALAGAATVAATGALAARLGGGALAQALAMACALVAPEYLGIQTFYSMNAFDVLTWTATALFVLQALVSNRHRDWVLVGLALGFGLLNKISVLWLGLGLGVALVLTPERRVLRTPGPWIAAAIAAACFLPHLVWQMVHGWPTLEFIRNATQHKMATEEKKELARLPQFFADMHGWDRMVGQVAAVFDALPAPDRSRAGIFASNYGEAGAIDLLGRSRGLPRAISGHNNYWLWGPRGVTGEVMIAVTSSRARLEELFEEVVEAGRIECGDCMPYENHRPIFVCRRLRTPLSELWPGVKHFD